jgi:putative transposase
MEKNYQTTTRRARTGRTTPKKARLNPSHAVQEAAIALPDTVTVAIAELAGELEEGLLAFVVGTGLKVLDVVLEAGCGAATTPSAPRCATGATPGP